MGFKTAFYASLEKVTLERGQEIRLAEKSGVRPGTLNKIINKASKDPQLSAIAKIIDSFDDATFFNFVKELRPELHIDIINLDGKHEVPTYNIDDINVVLAAMPEHKTRESLRHVLRDLPTVFNLQIPEKYFPSDFAVRVVGHSMEPDIPANAAVGLTMLKADIDFVAGEIYLCRLPYEGLVLRRVVVAPGQDALEFQALHNDREAYRSQIMHPDKALPLIYARVRWVAFRK